MRGAEELRDFMESGIEECIKKPISMVVISDILSKP